MGEKKRNQQMGKIETDRAGKGVKKRRQEKYKRPGSGVRSSVVRGTLLREPVAVVSGTASVHVIRQRASGSSPSHFVPPLTASRPDCLTDCWWESKAEREKRGRPLPPFVVSDEEISNVRQLKPMWKHPLKLAFPGAQWGKESIVQKDELSFLLSQCTQKHTDVHTHPSKIYNGCPVQCPAGHDPRAQIEFLIDVTKCPGVSRFSGVVF